MVRTLLVVSDDSFEHSDIIYGIKISFTDHETFYDDDENSTEINYDNTEGEDSLDQQKVVSRHNVLFECTRARDVYGMVVFVSLVVVTAFFVVHSAYTNTVATSNDFRQPSLAPTIGFQDPMMVPTTQSWPQESTQSDSYRFSSEGKPCFTSSADLFAAVDDFVAPGRQKDVVETYGSIPSWCFSEQVEALDGLFSVARNAYLGFFNGNISNWDVSNVVSMDGMFLNANHFNGDLSSWNISSVTSMVAMFEGASAFNSDLSMWDTSSTTSIAYMFQQAHSFNKDISYWDTSRVENLASIFSRAIVFDGDLSGWNVSKATDMSDIFHGAHSFTGRGIVNWDVSNVRDLSNSFRDATVFNGDLSQWNTSSLKDANGMFSRASMFDNDLSRWNLSIVTDMSGMFYEATAFQGRGLNTWEVSKVTRMSTMFYGASQFQGNLSLWDVSRVTTMYSMFQASLDVTGKVRRHLFNSHLARWNVTQVTNFAYMFNGASSFRHDLCSWGKRIQENADVRHIFFHSGCPSSVDPDVTVDPRGPFCHPCSTGEST